jgi:hypothetical protein
MLIQVIYADNSPGYEREEKLDELIRNRKILTFRRQGRWVKVGFDLITGATSAYDKAN